MAKQKDLHAELAKRKFGKPNIIPYFIYYVVGRTKLLGKQYNPKLEVIDKLPKRVQRSLYGITNLEEIILLFPL